MFRPMGSGDRRERERQEMRELILAAAMRLFLEESFEKTTMRRIAEAIEYTPGALYSYFKDKDEILYALHQRGFEILLAMQEEAARTAGPDPLVRLHRLGETYLEFAFKNPQYYDLMFISTSTARTIEASGAWEPGVQASELLAQAVRDSIAAGKLPAGTDARTVALTCWAQVHGLASLLMRRRLVAIPEAERERAVMAAFEWFSRLVRRPE
jgi:AcrR family transcriptional regulator